MAKTVPLQSAFTSGVLNPGLAARTDIQHYYQGARQGRNVVFVKEGGARGRWGRRYVGDGLGDGRLVPFSFNTEQNFQFLFSNLRLEIWLEDGTKVTNINGSGNDYLVTPWTLAQALELDFTQSSNTMVIMHEDVETRTLVRGADNATWTLATMDFENIPDFDYNDALSPAPTSHIVTLIFNTFSDGNRYKLELNNFETPDIVYSGTDVDANKRRIKEELLQLPPTGFDPGSITVTEAAGTYTITFSGDSADAYEDMTGRNTDKTTASITLTTTQTGVPRREACISATRGWPKTGTFYGSRLVFFGLKSLPQTILGTVIGGFFPFDFNIGTGLDDQAIFVTLNTDQVNSFRAAYPGRHLQAFTSGGEFYFPERVLTPAPDIPRQSKFGIAVGIKPVEVDGATIFVGKDRKSIREYLFLWAEEAYNATSLTVLSSHLLSAIQSLAALTSTGDDEDSYVLAVNDNGTGAILNTLRAQDIASWSEDRTRDGDKLKQVSVVNESIYYLVERTRNGATVYQLERADFTTRLDSAVTVTTGLGTTTVAGFDALDGETVQVLVDGAPIDDLTVSATGELTLPALATTSVEAGYFVPPVLETMPLVADLGSGPLLGAMKRLAEIRIAVKDTLGIIANGVKIPDKAPGVTATATPDAPYTGLLTTEDLGYDDGDVTITLTQDQPLPFHVLAIAAQLTIGKT